MSNITISFNTSRQRMKDILTTAVESGIAYWANDEDFNQEGCEVKRDANGYVESITLQLSVSAVKATSVPKFDPMAADIHTPSRATVTPEALAAAFGRMLSADDKGIMLDCSWAAAAELAGNFDANTADALVQFAFFGEVIYG
jgi:hypothetical protein